MEKIIKLYHGTDLVSAIEIVNNGFKMGPGVLGIGAYFKDNVEDARIYGPAIIGLILPSGVKIHEASNWDGLQEWEVFLKSEIEYIENNNEEINEGDEYDLDEIWERYMIEVREFSDEMIENNKLIIKTETQYVIYSQEILDAAFQDERIDLIASKSTPSEPIMKDTLDSQWKNTLDLTFNDYLLLLSKYLEKRNESEFYFISQVSYYSSKKQIKTIDQLKNSFEDTMKIINIAIEKGVYRVVKIEDMNNIASKFCKEGTGVHWSIEPLWRFGNVCVQGKINFDDINLLNTFYYNIEFTKEKEIELKFKKFIKLIKYRHYEGDWKFFDDEMCWFAPTTIL